MADDRDSIGLLRTFWRLPMSEQLRYGRLAFLAGLIEIALRIVPLGRLTRWLNVTTKWEATDRLGPRVDLKPSELLDVHRTIRLMQRWPFADGSCLRQALMVSVLLRLHAPVLCLGVANSSTDTVAHAWVEIGNATIGNPSGYIPFVARPPLGE